MTKSLVGSRKISKVFSENWKTKLLDRFEAGRDLFYPSPAMIAVEAGVFVASAFVLSFVYVSFLKRMVKTSSEVSKEKEESDKSRKEYQE